MNHSDVQEFPMLPKLGHDLVGGWVPAPDQRGTGDILFSCLPTIWLCTWTCLCLHIPTRSCRDGYRSLLYKLRWQLFAIFFPEVLVATAAEQWLSAHQSVSAFFYLGHREWTVRHGFLADMGYFKLKLKGGEEFAISSQQIAYLVKNKHMLVPKITAEQIKRMDKADGVARLVCLVQMGWFCLACVARGVEGIGFSTLEVTTLAFVLCTFHTFFFWYHKPLDPQTQLTIQLDYELWEISPGCPFLERDGKKTYTVTPLDYVQPAPDPRSLIAPFWFGFNVVFRHTYGAPQGPADTLPNSRIRPERGINPILSTYLLGFQFLYYGLHIGFAWIAAFPSRVEWYMWTVGNATDFGLILLYVLSIPVGTCFASAVGWRFFRIQAKSLLDVADALPGWAKYIVHGIFVYSYILGRLSVLVESLVSLRALPATVYQDVNWSAILPHL